jgi:uncharacterized protein YyaL (SSP411 family)
MASPVASALSRFTEPRLHVTVVGPSDDDRTRSLHRAALAVASPQRTVQLLDPADDTERLVRDGLALDADPQAYVCRGSDCLPPTTDPEAVFDLATTSPDAPDEANDERPRDAAT